MLAIEFMFILVISSCIVMFILINIMEFVEVISSFRGSESEIETKGELFIYKLGFLGRAFGRWYRRPINKE